MLGFAPYSAAAFADVGTGEQLFIPTGTAANGAIGTAESQAGVGVNVTGVSAASGVGSVTTTGSATITPAGVFAAGQVGQALVWGRIIPDAGTTWTRISA
jgi:hypothetical protein